MTNQKCEMRRLGLLCYIVLRSSTKLRGLAPLLPSVLAHSVGKQAKRLTPQASAVTGSIQLHQYSLICADICLINVPVYKLETQNQIQMIVLAFDNLMLHQTFLCTGRSGRIGRAKVSPQVWEIWSLFPGRPKPMTLKFIHVTSQPDAQHYEDRARTCQLSIRIM